MSRASLDKRPAEVSAMFDQVAGRYDLLNDVLSLGQDRWWRRAVARAVDARPGERMLDLAAGTGTSSHGFAGAGALCVACDFSLGMLEVGMRRLRRRRASGAGPAAAGAPPPTPAAAGASPPTPAAAGAPPPTPAAGRVSFVAGDALRLPFGDGSFDVVTISFGLRNVADPDAALAEMLRVTRPGGRLVICEFGHLPWPRLNALYGRYLSAVLPAIARRLSPAPDAYEYLAQSIQDWPAAPEVARRMGLAGWSAVRWRNLTLGVVTLHAARRPE